jgi:hypothetical protein
MPAILLLREPSPKDAWAVIGSFRQYRAGRAELLEIIGIFK